MAAPRWRTSGSGVMLRPVHVPKLNSDYFEKGRLVTTMLTSKASMLTALHTRPAGNGTG